MKRRNFLWLSVAGTAALALPSLRCSNRKERLQKVLAQPEVLSRIRDAKTIRAIGDSYRKKVSAENDEELLQNLLLRDIDGNILKTSADTSFIRTAIRKHIDKDFIEGRMTKVNGWILSVTEARQCALFSLIKVL